MEDNKTLVYNLRKKAHDLPEKFTTNAETIGLLMNAADAIESLADGNVLLNSKEFKPCPFCGGKPEIEKVTNHIQNNRIVVKCSVCGASTKTFAFEKPDLAKEAWNNRVHK